MERNSHAAGAVAVTAAAAGLLALTFGVRAVLGMFLGPLNSATGLGFASVSLALAVSQLASGIAQPVCGALADRYGAARLAYGGGLVLAAAMALLPWVGSSASLIIVFCLIAVAASAAGSMPALLAAVSARVPQAHRGLAAGVVGSGGSVGQLTLAPLTQMSISAAGWMATVSGLAVLCLAALPAARVLRGCHGRRDSLSAQAEPGVDVPVRVALGDVRFWLIAGGFFVCGFHVSFLLAHIPGIIEGCGSSAQLTGIWLALLGVANIAGSIGAGMAVQRFRLQRILASVYAARALGIGLFVLAPKSDAVLLAFAVWMGVSYMATVPPTSGLVARLYGARRLGTLFGVVMLVHQIGSFLGIWLGGLVYEQYGSFDAIWLLDIGLAALAVMLNLAIRERATGANVTPDPRKTRPASGPADRSAPSALAWRDRQSAPQSSHRIAAPSAAAGSG